MVHARIVVLDQMPLNPNGKTDCMALSAHQVEDHTSPLAVAQAKPATPAERALHGIWARLLDQHKIGVDADLFELGGHSLLAIKLFTQIKRNFGAESPISTLFAHPTISSLGRELETPPALANDAPLFIVGGNMNNLVTLGRLIGAQRAAIGLQTRGIPGHRMHDTIEATTADHLANIRRHQPQGPYLLAGYFGGVYAAYEMACQLRDAGEDAAFLGLMDTPAPNFTYPTSGSLFARIRYMMRLLRLYSPQPIWINAKAWLTNKVQLDFVVRVAEALSPEKLRHVHLSRQWWKISSLYGLAPYDGDAWLSLTESKKDGFTATQLRKSDHNYGWPAFIHGTLRVSRHTSDHFSMLTGAAVQNLAYMIEIEIKHSGQGK